MAVDEPSTTQLKTELEQLKKQLQQVGQRLETEMKAPMVAQLEKTISEKKNLIQNSMSLEKQLLVAREAQEKAERAWLSRV